MGTKIHPKSMKNRGCVADAFLERFWSAFWRQGGHNATSLGAIWTHFPSKIKKACRNRQNIINMAPKMDPKSKNGIQKSM